MAKATRAVVSNYGVDGYYYDTQVSLVFKGKEDSEKIGKIMEQLRNGKVPFTEKSEVIDYKKV